MLLRNWRKVFGIRKSGHVQYGCNNNKGEYWKRVYTRISILTAFAFGFEIVQQLRRWILRVLLSENWTLNKRYWEQHLWSGRYFCRNVGNVTWGIIEDYIENQADEYDENFKIVGWIYLLNVLPVLGQAM